MPPRSPFRSYTIFLSSPGDVSHERKLAREIIGAVNNTIRDILHINFHVVSWEDLPPQTPRADEGSIQDQLNKLVDKSHIFLLILNKRYGTIERGHTKSNTEREIDTILERHKQDSKVSILSYFKALSKNEDPGNQEAKAKDLRARLRDSGIFFKEFEDQTDFRERFTHDLYSLAIKLRLSPYKADCLAHFWSMPMRESADGIDIAIVYRPVTRGAKDARFDGAHWQSRLMPAVSLEDTKAIQKVQKHLRTLGIRSKVFRNAEVPADLSSTNRLWICAPRVPAAEAHLKKRGDRVHFSFSKKKEREATLEWRNRSGCKMTISSPLSKYLKAQRGTREGEWNGSLANVVAKDFGIIARFSNSGENSTADFVIAGIRGLGTWGAAWYLDRRYKQLRSLRESGDVQILLEVTYKNGMIADVRDVSDEGPDYFERQLSSKYIRSVIDEALHGGPSH